LLKTGCDDLAAGAPRWFIFDVVAKQFNDVVDDLRKKHADDLRPGDDRSFNSELQVQLERRF
jgi:hypothetical protein